MNEGFLVKVAHDGEAAIEDMRLTYYDFVYLDLMMPKLNGLDVLTAIKRDKIKVGPVVIFTALFNFFSPENDTCAKYGAVGYEVLGNISPNDAAKKIRNYLQGYTPGKVWIPTVLAK